MELGVVVLVDLERVKIPKANLVGANLSFSKLNARGGQTDRAGLFGTSQGAVPLDIGTAGRQGRGTEDR
jgi:hypothetical protein